MNIFIMSLTDIISYPVIIQMELVTRQNHYSLKNLSANKVLSKPQNSSEYWKLAPKDDFRVITDTWHCRF